MSERCTSVEVPGASGLIVRGHVGREVAVAECRAMYEHNRDEAEAALAALRRGNVRVFHQNGLHVARNRHELPVEGGNTVNVVALPTMPAIEKSAEDLLARTHAVVQRGIDLLRSESYDEFRIFASRLPNADLIAAFTHACARAAGDDEQFSGDRL